MRSFMRSCMEFADLYSRHVIISDCISQARRDGSISEAHISSNRLFFLHYSFYSASVDRFLVVSNCCDQIVAFAQRVEDGYFIGEITFDVYCYGSE